MSEQEPADALPETDAEWREHLSADAYRILREDGTEPRYSSELLDVKADGEFRCTGCDQVLFTSGEKYDSGTGWPSFWAPADADAVATEPDRGLLGTRTEVLCSRCEGHLGHVFDDGPDPTGKRFCINGDALAFDADE